MLFTENSCGKAAKSNELMPKAPDLVARFGAFGKVRRELYIIFLKLLIRFFDLGC